MELQYATYAAPIVPLLVVSRLLLLPVSESDRLHKHQAHAYPRSFDTPCQSSGSNGASKWTDGHTDAEHEALQQLQDGDRYHWAQGAAQYQNGKELQQTVQPLKNQRAAVWELCWACWEERGTQTERRAWSIRTLMHKRHGMAYRKGKKRSKKYVRILMQD
ncbi:hypothetical protein LX32DRAFT_657617 [Colletotrichum zoysiae]|uniref:Secreted protein n=1 Tax=Colletotrichum zoysiae TaxID=1216348 RepID=A0AAD9H510_9PEZI|nr:hypothetical protein LX32DRAFT_657617 [Colletotrichum zoysiae]